MIRRAILLGLLWSVLLAGCHAQTTALAADGHVGKDLPIPCSSAAEATSEHGTQWTSGTQRSSGRDNQKTQPAKGTCRKTVLFAAGKGGYHTYRIPSIIVTTRGTVLAFCEGRKESSRDLGNIDMLVRRSLDGGRTFGPMRVIWNDGPNTCGNPCPVIDRTTGAVWLLMTHNLEKDGEKAITNRKAAGTRTVWIAHSTDDGQTWSRPIEITNDAKRPDWTWYATGPGAGIQLRNSRLIIPCDHRGPDKDGYYSHVIYSDDAGKTWQIGGTARPAVNECEAVELADGRLMLNMRNYDRQHHTRAVATSDDGGLSWSDVTHDPALIEPICQASIRRYSLASGGRGQNQILFSNPASTTDRERMTVRLSLDEARTWPVARVLHPGPSAYSCLAVLPNGRILCLYECGKKFRYETLTLADFDLAWLKGK